MTRDVWDVLFLSFLSFLSAMPLFINTSSPYSTQRPSHASECDSLLQFSQSFTISSAYYLCDDTSYPKTASWKNGTNCCSWDGVTCHTSTDYVIGLDLSCSWLQGTLHSNNTLFSLRNLQRLNLAGNNFSGSQISSRFGIITGLAHLNLSRSSFSGTIPLEMISHHLSNLISLDLAGNYDLTIEDHSFRRFVSNITQLRELALDSVDMSSVSLTSFTNLSSTLTSLSLGGCLLQGTFPINIFHLPNLRILVLSQNYNLTGTLPQTNWSSSPLVRLSLALTKFHGPIPDSVWNLTSLEYLELLDNEFTGLIPPTLGNLGRLSFLNVGGINFSGTVDFDMFARLKNLESLYLSGSLKVMLPNNRNYSFPRLKELELDLAVNLNVMLPNNGNCSFPRLKQLSLYGINLTEFPCFLRSSPELERVDISGNKISGPIPEWFGRVGSNTLTDLHLSSNNFTGEIPSSICQLSSLSDLILSDNRLNSTIPRCLGNLSNLFEMDLVGNQLQGPLPRSLANCTSLEHLSVANNEIYDAFPHWLLNANQALNSLYLDSNMFHGVINEIPLPPQLEGLSLSNNQFSGHLPIDFFRNSTGWRVDLANNNFDGPLPIPPPNVWFYSVANNKFSGDIPHQFCNATELVTLNFSCNSLTGSIPHCFINLSATVLDLRANKLIGHIPDIFFSWNYVRAIWLSQNRLEGTLPRSLANCKNLIILDLSENELEDHFPYWLDTLPFLQVLNLRSNKLRGLINSSRKNNHPFPELHIFDLSDNSFYGHLPAKYIANFIAMKDEQRSALEYMGLDPFNREPTYQYSVTVVMKGFEIELVRILTGFMTIDFSRNFFEGEVPELIGDLKALKGLNISHNNLTGNIPSSVGNLTNLEWLDLSSNKFNGEIPRGLADLSWLGWLNLSDNQLVGPIPRSTQFDTFSHSFDGNPGLCGHPLPKACGTDDQPPPSTSPGEREEEAGSRHWIEWRAVPMGYGCGLALGISAWFIMWETLRPRWLVRMIEGLIYRTTKRKMRNVAPRNRSRKNTRGQ
ncbi:receptor-like protein 9DC1 [Punica granatum]|uniref:Receptor-like protein 9DC1 n=1 Tax=Punica granatum TaxID=22663 RepID=A0A6P8EEF5_PUNGR|nr:receptor-like protein 9DC1 [Punica granatum]